MRFQSLFPVACCVLYLFTSGCAAKPETTEEHLARALKHISAAEYQKAEKAFQEVLRIDPSNQKAIRELGLVYYDQGLLRQAFPLLKKSAETLPGDLDVQIKLAVAYFTARDFQNARDIAQQIVEKNPEHEEALLLITDTASTAEEVEAARRYIEDHVKNRDSAAYHLALGALELHQRKFAAAEPELNAALQRNPKSSAAHIALGNLYLSQQNLKAAEDAYQKAAELSPPRSPARLRYIDFKLLNGDTATATQLIDEIARQSPEFLPTRVYLMKIACAEKRDDCASKVDGVLAQDASNYDALFQSGTLSLQQRDIARAIRIFSQLTNFNDRDPRVRYQLGVAYLASTANASPIDARNALNTAENNLDIARQLDPRLVDAALLLAEIKIRKGAPAAAVDLLLPVTKQMPQLAKAQYLLATAYSAQRLHADAATVYQHMIETFPKDPEPSLFLARIMLQNQQTAEARKVLQQSLDISPTYLPAVELLVDLDIIEKQYAAALQRVQPFVEGDPKAAQPLAIRGKIYGSQGDWPRAEADLAKSVELDPKLESTHILLAKIYVAAKKPEKAIEVLKSFAATSKSVSAYQLLAALYLNENKVNETRDTYEAMLKVAPNSSVAMNNLAVLYAERLDQLDTALNWANKARETTPGDPHIGDTIGWISFKRGDYQSALREIKASASQLPDAEVQYHLGMAYYMLGDEQQAQVALQKAIQTGPNLPEKVDVQQRLEVLSLKAEATARPQLEKFLAAKPNDPVALSRLADLETNEGKAEQAKTRLEKTVDQNPQFAPATRQLALLYGKLFSQDPKAFDMVRRARQNYPEDAEIAKILGIMTYRRGFAPQSLELLKEAAAKRKDDAELLYYLGEDYRELKDFDACKETLQRALSLNLSADLAGPANKALSECTATAPP
jgi:tetratricopeptide (TPR) repeat protein